MCPKGPPLEEGSFAGEYTFVGGPGKAESAQSVAVARSIKWPGAVCVAKEGKTVTCVYNGFGLPSPPCMGRSQAFAAAVAASGVPPQLLPYQPPMPTTAQDEYKDPDAPEEEREPDADGNLPPPSGATVMLESPDVTFEPKGDGDDADE